MLCARSRIGGSRYFFGPITTSIIYLFLWYSSASLHVRLKGAGERLLFIYRGGLDLTWLSLLFCVLLQRPSLLLDVLVRKKSGNRFCSAEETE